MLNKTVIVINGSGSSGKDTICDIVSKHYLTMNRSSVDLIKEIAHRYGWKGTKEPKDRKLLSDLKKAFSDYNDMPNTYLLNMFYTFMTEPHYQIMFVHIREIEENRRFFNRIYEKIREYSYKDVSIASLLILRPNQTLWGNESDDNINPNDYRFIYRNERPLDELEQHFMPFFNCLLWKLEEEYHAIHK